MTKKRMITIDDAIATLQAARKESKLGGETVLVLSLTDAEIETVPIDELACVNDADGAVLEVRATIECL